MERQRKGGESKYERDGQKEKGGKWRCEEISVSSKALVNKKKKEGRQK